MDYVSMDKAALSTELQRLQNEYDGYVAQGLKLDMSRGKPSPQQLDLSNGIFSVQSYIDEDGLDTRNYGFPAGGNEARRFFADMMGVAFEETIVGGNASLSMMYNMIDLGWSKGFVKGEKPWKDCSTPKFLCPAPGYDRHFKITEVFGFDLISVPMTPDGPDMDVVEALAKDGSVKGIWCVPIYSNPEGYVYSDDTVKRLAAMEAAPDFRIFWDNAYAYHHLTQTPQSCLNILDECRKAGFEDRPLLFCSTSKITFAGAGVAAMSSSKANIAVILDYYASMIITFDKLNQLRHVRFLKQEGGLAAHMENHRAVLAPRFQMVIDILEDSFADTKNIAQWTNPKGGYFISLFVKNGCAARAINLCKQAGLVLTDVGAAYPYGKDPADSLVRIAPSYPEVDELETATRILCVATKLAAVEKLLAENE